MVAFSRVSSLSHWFLLLLLLNLFLPVIFAMPESYSFNCPDGEYQSNDVCCKTCPSGTFVKAPCKIPHTQGQCEKCHPGTFTGKDNGLHDCELCSTCDKDQEMVADCSVTSDRKCQCQTGLYYYDPKFPESCRPCTKGTVCLILWQMTLFGGDFVVWVVQDFLLEISMANVP
uniref:TNFR-Cys domain-containing protein n=1 Tax=Mus spicilegus TaxID=10103 RepID=A0A8C6GJW2_MUSSI